MVSNYPESHYGRDALVGIAYSEHLAHDGKKVTWTEDTYPPYLIARIALIWTRKRVDAILAKIKDTV